MSVVRGPTWHIRVEIGRGAAITWATARPRKNAREKGALVEERVWRVFLTKTVTGGVGVGPCHPEGLSQGISHIYPTFSLKPFHNKILGMHTTGCPPL